MSSTFFRAFVIAASTLTITACATAPAPSGGKTANITKAKEANSRLAEDPNDPIVCEKKKITGELIPRKVCLPQSVWAARKQDAKDMVDGVQRNSLSSCIPSAGGACGG